MNTEIVVKHLEHGLALSFELFISTLGVFPKGNEEKENLFYFPGKMSLREVANRFSILHGLSFTHDVLKEAFAFFGLI